MEVRVMDDPQIPPLKTRILVRSCQLSRLRRELLIHAYQQVCPETRQILRDSSISPSPAPVREQRSSAAYAAAGA
jgi:hypothetical protein